MPVFKSRINASSDSFQKNRADMLALIDQLRVLEERAVTASGRRRKTFESRGQIPPHDRVARLLDPGMPFLRLHTLSNYLNEDPDPDTSIPGGSVILGIGFVSGVRCMVWADDSGIRAGAATRSGWMAALSAQELALRHRLPLIHLVESAGANLMEYEVELWAEAGKLFRNLARLSAAGIPTMVVLHGPSTAGGAYMPGMSDYVVGVKHNGLAALGGAALVRAATGEVADERELGGTEMHSTVTGLVEYLAEDDAHGIDIARGVIDRLDWNRRVRRPERRPCERPLYDVDEIAGIVPVDYTVAYDVREVLARLVDGSDFEEFKPRFGAATVCVQASIMGFVCGIIGNNGPFDPAGANKATQFFQLCDSADMPIIFLNNITGYMVGTEYEHAGMIKHGAKMIQAVTNVRVPRISLYIGASYGAGNYGMCGYSYEPDFLFSWPNASTGVMGGEQAARTMRQVAEVGALRRGEAVDHAALDVQTATIVDRFSRQESAFFTSGRNLDHGVIDPRDSRKVLGFALETCLEGRNRELRPNSFGVARL
ncbi:MAG: carboxyl transferase domain-containing protein [Pseudomonadales bacterium]